MLEKAVDGQFYSLVRHINTKSDLKAPDYTTLLYFAMCMYVYTHTKINSGNVATCKMIIKVIKMYKPVLNTNTNRHELQMPTQGI